MNAAPDHISDFVSLAPGSQDSQLHIPPTHRFQKLIEAGEGLSSGETHPVRADFTAYIPINDRSELGYLSINTESGGVSQFNVDYDAGTGLWRHSQSQRVDFSPVVQTANNCSGAVTPWGSVISCEETTSTADTNSDGYHDLGWCVEIDPASKSVVDKLWALGKFKHENVAIHPNQRTVYQGADSSPGYLYKFVADTAADLSQGDLYVYKGAKNGSGQWVELDNITPMQRNSTLSQSANVGATVFNGVEDVEIGSDGWVYFAVKNESRVYRLMDDNLLDRGSVLTMETFVGGQSYTVSHVGGSSLVEWGRGNDNLAFDNHGNLWVMQDGGDNHIWLVGKDHRQAQPKVRIFARTPRGSEPTGMTFTPDYRFMFVSFQHPASTNDATTQLDAAGVPVGFDKDISVVIALNADLGN